MSSNMPQHDPVPGADHAPATSLERSAGTQPAAGYEKRDANIRAILWLVVAVLITCAFVFWASLGLRDHFERVAKSNDPEQSPLADTEQLPPAPRLQDTPIRDLAEFRAAQEQTLTSYAWIDREKDQVQIPVERAMELILQRGLPAPTGPAGPQSSESNSAQNESADNSSASAPPENGPAPSEASPNRQPPENR